jgi:hypothetical protein
MQHPTATISVASDTIHTTPNAIPVFAINGDPMFALAECKTPPSVSFMAASQTGSFSALTLSASVPTPKMNRINRYNITNAIANLPLVSTLASVSISEHDNTHEIIHPKTNNPIELIMVSTIIQFLREDPHAIRNASVSE